MYHRPTVRAFESEVEAREHADILKSRPSRSLRKFVARLEGGEYRIRRDTYSGRKVWCTWLCTDGRFRFTGHE